MHEIESACFLVCAVKKKDFKQFSYKVLNNYCSNFYLERFGQYLKKSQNGFPIVFFKCNFKIA